MKLLLIGQLLSKSNSRMVGVNKKTRKPYTFKNPKTQKIKRDFIIQLKAQWNGRPPIPEPVHLICKVFYQSRRSDLDISLLMDALQDAGVVENDRHIWKVKATKDIDKLNPRVEMEIMPMDET